MCIDAFSYKIYIDNLPLKNEENSQTSLFINKDINIPKSYDNILQYNQNQNREVSLSTNYDFFSNQKKQKWMFSIDSVVSFTWEKASNHIYYKLYEKGDNKLLQYWLLHTFLPLYLSIEGRYELIHAGGVEINNKPVLFIAPSFGGKSTLTDYFIKKDHVMVSDDRVGLKEINSIIFCSPSYPYHRPYRKMEDLGVQVKNFMNETKALHCIYVLEPVEKSAKIDFILLEGIEKFKALQYNFDINLPLNKASSFELIAKIAALVPIYKLYIPWDLKQLDHVYKAVCKHSQSLS